MRFEHLSLVDQRNALLDQVESLKSEMTVLKKDLRILEDADFEMEIQRKWGLTRQRVEILMILYRARGRSVSHDFIHRSLSECGFCIRREDTSLELIKVQVCHIRRIIGKQHIVTVWGVGFALSDEMVAIIDDLKSEFDGTRAANKQVAS